MKKPKVTLSETFFNKEDGLSIVTLSTPLGHFSGHAICNTDEGDEFNEYVGGSYAELRAWIKYYKQEMFKYRTLIKELNGIYCCCKHSEKTAKLVKERLDYCKDQYDEYQTHLAMAKHDLVTRNEYLDKKEQ